MWPDVVGNSNQKKSKKINFSHILRMKRKTYFNCHRNQCDVAVWWLFICVTSFIGRIHQTKSKNQIFIYLKFRDEMLNNLLGRFLIINDHVVRWCLIFIFSIRAIIQVIIIQMAVIVVVVIAVLLLLLLLLTGTLVCAVNGEWMTLVVALLIGHEIWRIIGWCWYGCYIQIRIPVFHIIWWFKKITSYIRGGEKKKNNDCPMNELHL